MLKVTDVTLRPILSFPILSYPFLSYPRLRQQTEELMQEPDFVDQITKAFAGLGEPPKGGSDTE